MPQWACVVRVGNWSWFSHAFFLSSCSQLNYPTPFIISNFVWCPSSSSAGLKMIHSDPKPLSRSLSLIFISSILNLQCQLSRPALSPSALIPIFFYSLFFFFFIFFLIDLPKEHKWDYFFERGLCASAFQEADCLVDLIELICLSSYTYSFSQRPHLSSYPTPIHTKHKATHEILWGTMRGEICESWA